MPAQSIQPASDLPSNFTTAHNHVLADKAIQFKFTPFQPPKVTPPPHWLKVISEDIAWFLRLIGPFANVLFWALVIALVAIILFFILRELGYVHWTWRKKAVAEANEDWHPDDVPARKLLAEADALAAEGQFEEAAHLLLLRSFEDIDRRRPGLLKPANTAREMATSGAIPTNARDTFGHIARHVEASLFGGDTLGRSGWEECRAAYARFVTPGDWA